MLKKFNFIAFSVLCVSLLTIFGFEIFAVAQMAFQSRVSLSYSVPHEADFPTGPLVNFTDYKNLGDVSIKYTYYDGDEEIDAGPVTVDPGDGTAPYEVYPGDPNYPYEAYPKLKFTSNGDGTCQVSQVNPLFTKGNVTIPEKSPAGDTVTSIANYGFMGCYDLISVKKNESIYDLGFQSFRDCVKLETVDVPVYSVQAYQGGLFYNCPSFISCNGANYGDVIISESLEWRGETYYNVLVLAFPGATLEHVHDEGVSTIGPYAYAGVPTGSEGEEIQDFIYYDNIERIGQCAFEASITAGRVYLGSSLTTIEAGAFAFCKIEELNTSDYSSDQYFYFDGGMLIEQSTHYVVAGTLNLGRVEIGQGEGILGVYPLAFAGCYTTELFISFDIQEIGYGAFAGCPIGDGGCVVDNTRYTSLGTNLIYDQDTQTLIHAFQNADVTVFEAESLDILEIGAYACYSLGYRDGEISDCNFDISQLVNRCSKIGIFAFYSCYGYGEQGGLVINLFDEESYVGECAFYDCMAVTGVSLALIDNYYYSMPKIGPNAFMMYTQNNPQGNTNYNPIFKIEIYGNDIFIYESNLDGTCIVHGLQTSRNIPSVSPFGDYVLETRDSGY